MKILSKQLKNILFLGNHFGQKKIWEEIPVYLSQNGWDTIIASKKINPFLRLIDMVWVLWSNRKKYTLAVVDVFSGKAIIWSGFSILLLSLLRKKIILNLHGGNLPSFARSYPYLINWILRKANVVISPSEYLKSNLSKYRHNIKVIPNPINISSYHVTKKFGKGVRLIWLRAFHDIYNPSLCPKVFAIINIKYPNSYLTMIGPDKGDGSLLFTKKTSESLSLNSNFQICNEIHRDNVPLILNQNDIFLNTTNFDNTPVSVIEAMASGLCIVSTNVGGIPYLLENESDAILVPPDDPDAMAEAILRILNDPVLAEKLSTNARKKAELFDWSIVLPKWEKLLNDLINNEYL